MDSTVSFVSLSEKYAEIAENQYILDRDKESLKYIAEQVLESDDIEGSDIDFHNLAVDLGTLNQFKLACEILERGISRYKNSVDLLADYLFYGKDFEVGWEKSKNYYDILQSIPDRLWTWRGYAFSLEHLASRLLRETSQEDSAKIEEDRKSIINRYYEKFPNEELPYIAEANVYKGVNLEEEWNILERAIANLDNCPRCTMRYVELLLSKSNATAEYALLADKLNYAKLQVNRDLDFGYAQYLRAICLMRLLDQDSYKDADKIKEIYRCFSIAQDELLRVGGNTLNIIRKQIRMLEILSEIEYE